MILRVAFLAIILIIGILSSMSYGTDEGAISNRINQETMQKPSPKLVLNPFIVNNASKDKASTNQTLLSPEACLDLKTQIVKADDALGQNLTEVERVYSKKVESLLVRSVLS
jgi:hypothetical protein